MKPILFNLQMFLLLALGFVGHAQVLSRAENHMPSPFQKIESKALLADVEKPSTINDLAHEVISYPHIYQIPSPLNTILELDLSKAETAYRNNTGPGVSEAQLLDLINLLAAKFKVPEYAKTTAPQIRVLRMGLAVESPVLMGKGLAATGMKVGDSIQPVMSPLQAMHLLGVMIDQKVLNPDYQDPSIDPNSRNQERFKKFKEMRQAGKIQTDHILITTSNPKRVEISRCISSGTASMSMKDAYNLLDQTLTTMRLK